MLRRVKVTKVWGVGKRLAIRLEGLGITSAWEVASANPKLVRQRSSVFMERTIEELNGRPCLEFEEQPPAKKQIYCTRSFGKKATTLRPILEAVSLYASRAAEKLRAQDHLALTMHIFLHTSPFKHGFHSVSQMAQLPYPTNDSRAIVALARTVARQLYTEGHAFLKAGVGLVDIVDRQHYQFDMLHPGQGVKSDRVMETLDRINQSQGLGTVFFAAQGVSKPWYMRQQFTSPQYTTKWSDLPTIYA